MDKPRSGSPSSFIDTGFLDALGILDDRSEYTPLERFGNEPDAAGSGDSERDSGVKRPYSSDSYDEVESDDELEASDVGNNDEEEAAHKAIEQPEQRQIGANNDS